MRRKCFSVSRNVVAAHTEALKERTRARVPLDWAATQRNRRHDLAAVGKAYYHSGPDRLRSRWLWIRLSILPATRSHRSPAFRFRSASAWIIE